METLRPVIDDFSFNKICNFIRDNYGINLNQSKKSLVESRLGSRLRILNFSSYHDYFHHVFNKKNQKELDLLVDLITTNKTDFFRESDHFDYLENYLIPEFLTNFGTSHTLKIWSSACSSGEEVYTLAMVLEEFSLRQRITYELSGSDLSMRMLEKAKQGVYSLNSVSTVPAHYKKKYLMKSKDPKKPLVKIKPQLRNKVSFYKRNLMSRDYGKEKYHIIFCRNVLIYFNKDNQEKVINKLAANLYPGGYLFLGHSESALGMKVNVKQIKPTIYRKEL